MSEIQVGQEVTISSYYISNYPSWDIVGKIAKVLAVKQQTIGIAAIAASKDDLARYVARYGKLNEYPLMTLVITFPGISDSKYIVSQFGVDIVELKKEEAVSPPLPSANGTTVEEKAEEIIS